MKDFLFWLSRKTQYPFVRPSILQISLTYRCNLRCKMCSIAGLLPEEEELSTEKVKRVVDEAKRYGIHEILLTGGEPFLRKDIFDICRYSHEHGLRTIVTTNGIDLNEALVGEIVNSKIGHIHISIDGLEAAHDSFRGRGAFAKVIRSIYLLNNQRKHQRSFSIGIACTVMNDNVKDMLALVRQADDLGVDVINFQPLVKDNANFMDKKLPSCWVQGENLDVLKQQIRQIRSFQPKHISIYEEPALEMMIKYYAGTLSKKDWVCFGGFKTVFVCFSKNEPLVYSCHGICGSLDKMTLKQAWESREAYQLRIHSRNCKELCMQSCYSQQQAQGVLPLKRLLLGGFKKNGQ